MNENEVKDPGFAPQPELNIYKLEEKKLLAILVNIRLDEKNSGTNTLAYNT
jgi:hypothetical protein